jgi:hypothetical protein
MINNVISYYLALIFRVRPYGMNRTVFAAHGGVVRNALKWKQPPRRCALLCTPKTAHFIPSNYPI